LPDASVWGCEQAPHNGWERIGSTYRRLESIRPFYLSIPSRVSHGVPVHLNVVGIAKVQKFLPGKLCPIVRGNQVQDSEPKHNIPEEANRLVRLEQCERLSFDPLGELVDGHQHMCEAPSVFLSHTV
jgi:hypothetical protein